MNDEARELQEWRDTERRRLGERHDKGEITDAEYRRQLEEIAKPK